jgi:diguanylate cyclase (GGDEF)-like protein
MYRTEYADNQAKFGATSNRVTLTIVAIGAALLLFIIYAGVSANRSAKEAQRSLIDAAITDLANQTLMEQKGWAFWDEAARATRKGKLPATWFDQQVGAALTEGYRHERVYVIDGHDRAIYGYGGGKRISSDGLKHLWPAIWPMLREIRSGVPRNYVRRDRAFSLAQERYDTLWNARAGRGAANMLRDGPRIVVVAIMTIVPTVDRRQASRHPHLLLSIVPLDQTVFAMIGRKLQLENLRLVDPRTSDERTPLMTDDGQPAGAIAWNVDRPGDVMLKLVLPAVTFLLLIALRHSRTVMKRLEDTHRQLQTQEASARFLALHDPLSELPNRRHFSAELQARLDRAAASRDIERICVAYLDVDRFKDVNDAIGHSAGDSLVMQIGPRLKNLLRAGDFLARLGGDEFAVLRTLTSKEDPALLGREIISAFNNPFQIEGNSLEVTASIGLAVARPGETDPEHVLQDADISLYRAKDGGRNRYILFERGMAEDVRLRHQTEIDLRSAIGTDQIVVEYQPVISTITGKVTSFEALARWRHPHRGLIPPLLFVPIAEQSGLMVPLGDYIAERIFREASAPAFAGMHIAINLSPIQLRQRGLPDRLAQLARRFGLAPERVILEVTESLLIESNEVTTEVFARLRAAGFRTALDDFGTGYSSLAYLGMFEFDKLKIDRSFISKGSLEKLRPILEGIVHIGRGLRMDIVAEGIETAAELAMVRALGCNEAQGFYISEPLPADAVSEFLLSASRVEESPPLIHLAKG